MGEGKRSDGVGVGRRLVGGAAKIRKNSANFKCIHDFPQFAY